MIFVAAPASDTDWVHDVVFTTVIEDNHEVELSTLLSQADHAERVHNIVFIVIQADHAERVHNIVFIVTQAVHAEWVHNIVPIAIQANSAGDFTRWFQLGEGA